MASVATDASVLVSRIRSALLGMPDTLLAPRLISLTATPATPATRFCHRPGHNFSSLQFVHRKPGKS